MISLSFRKALSEKEDIGRGSFGCVFAAKRSDGVRRCGEISTTTRVSAKHVENSYDGMRSEESFL